MDKAKEHNRLDKMIARTKELQKEIDHRHEVEEKVFELFSEGKFEEGDALLATLDDDRASSSDKSYTEGHEEVKRVKQLGRMFVKKEPFEIMAAFASTLFRFFYLTMKLNKNFRMVLEYDAEATNVYVHFEKIMESFSRCNHPEY